MANHQGNFLVRDRLKGSRFYTDNEFVLNGYMAFLGRLALLYYCLLEHANAETQTCYPSYETLIIETGIKNRNTLAAAINVLEYLGIIGIERGSMELANDYYILPHSQWKPLNDATRAVVKAVSKMPTRQYQKHSFDTRSDDTPNQLITTPLPAKAGSGVVQTKEKTRIDTPSSPREDPLDKLRDHRTEDDKAKADEELARVRANLKERGWFAHER